MCYMPTHWPSLLRQVYALEAAHNTYAVKYPREDAVHYLPFPVPEFIKMLTSAVMHAPDRIEVPLYFGPGKGTGLPAAPEFLDVGCGNGTKMQLAQELFRCTVTGIDIVPQFISDTRERGMHAYLIDAFAFEDYASYDIVFVNRPSTLQDELEKLVCAQMASGAVLMAANWRHDPTEFGLEPMDVEYGRPVCGVWRKP